MAERLGKAKLFLRENYGDIDPRLPQWLSVLRSAGASECFHKHGTFYQHLLEVYRILVLWGAPDEIARCGLFHSAYSNSYVNLAIFEPGIDRSRVRDLIGDAAEELVELFCIVPRQQLVHDMLLFRFTDEELGAAAAGGPRAPVLLPDGFLRVKNIRTGEEDALCIPRLVVAAFVLLTMADFADQLYNWQDKLFENDDGKLDFHGNSYSALWPGDVKPGLWMSSISRMGLLLRALFREEERYPSQLNQIISFNFSSIHLPPVFDHCSMVLDPDDQMKARDLYLEAAKDNYNEASMDEVVVKLEETIKLNPWIGEPHLVLAQVHCISSSFVKALREAEIGLELLLQWGTCWDKRVSWEAWIAWARVLKMNATNQTWPTSSWGMINLGLVNSPLSEFPNCLQSGLSFTRPRSSSYKKQLYLGHVA